MCVYLCVFITSSHINPCDADGLLVVSSVRALTVSTEPWTRWTMKEVQRRTPVRMVSERTNTRI